MTTYKKAIAGLFLATSMMTAHALAADTTGTGKPDTGVHKEIRSGAAETPTDVKGQGGGILDSGPVKVRPEDQKGGKADKMYDNQYETNKTKKKAE
ncbi:MULTISPECIES: hypothetical protein [Pseudomonas]|uniref:Uncharacterized protein n=1 Tax=Pseudomonas quercus TaxID=2722792 RepID=A0ABX0Y9X2_9PSED|nr:MULTISPECIES: hypothetical protein [Pseudomonas]MBF7141234.1 hypothetical protein [Pseudomonas sp. LY10J]NJO99769.1 hypothetical protein [Pseudomonas quercus]